MCRHADDNGVIAAQDEIDQNDAEYRRKGIHAFVLQVGPVGGPYIVVTLTYMRNPRHCPLRVMSWKVLHFNARALTAGRGADAPVLTTREREAIRIREATPLPSGSVMDGMGLRQTMTVLDLSVANEFWQKGRPVLMSLPPIKTASR